MNRESFANDEIDLDIGKSLSVPQIKKTDTDDRDLLNQLLGQAQAAQAFQKISQTIGVSKLAYVKENKLYRALKGMKNPNGTGFLTGTWEEFCLIFDMSDEKANQDIANLKAFGEEALDSMTRIGIGYRDMQQYRKLPEDERSALIEAAKTGDKDQLLELAESLIEKHVKEKEVYQKEILDKSLMLDDMENAKSKQIKHFEAELDHRDALIDKLKSRDNRKYNFQPKTHIAREECLVYQAECELALESLQALFDDSLNDLVEIEKRMRVDQVWLTACVVLARASRVVSNLRDMANGYGFVMPDDISSKHSLTDDESERWLLDYQGLQRKAAAEKAIREQRRLDAMPKGPGRPRAGK